MATKKKPRKRAKKAPKLSFIERLAQGFAAAQQARIENAKRLKKELDKGAFPVSARPQREEARKGSGRKRGSVKGNPLFQYELREVHDPKGKAPSDKRIESWCLARRNVEYWKNKDGSWNAIASFTGRDAWERAQVAASRVPPAAYLAFRYTAKKTHVPDGPRERSTDVSAAFGSREMITRSTPTVTQRNWRSAYNAVFAGFDEGENDGRFYAGVYLRRAGLVVYWPPKKGD